MLLPFIVDFVEVDGGYHAARQAADAARDAELARLHGVRVLRFDAARVERALGCALAELATAC